MRLNELRDNPGATRKRKRLGRGAGSGMGSTSTHGHKGQKARSGVAIKGFEGGQMPLHRRLPKRGFTNPSAKEYAVTNLGKIQAWIDAGRLDAGAPIDEAALVASGLIRRRRDGIRVLGRGEITSKGLTIAVTGASRSAIAAVEAAGGTLSVTAPAAETAEAGEG
jgi:large subunit ribosomal protein L15